MTILKVSSRNNNTKYVIKPSLYCPSQENMTFTVSWLHKIVLEPSDITCMYVISVGTNMVDMIWIDNQYFI